MIDALVLLVIAVGLSLAMTAAWAVQRKTGASGWIDTIWSLAVGAGGVAAIVAADGTPEAAPAAAVTPAVAAEAE